MMIFKKFVIFCLLLICSFLPVRGEQITCVTNGTTFTITEDAVSYIVTCHINQQVHSSRGLSLIEKHNRLTSLNIVGTYILFQQTNWPKEYFQLYGDAINLQYSALVEGAREERVINTSDIQYVYPKKNYHIEYASYTQNININQLLQDNYNRLKNEESAFHFYNIENFSSSQYLRIEHDFLSGQVRLPYSIRTSLALDRRLELSVYNFYNADYSLPEDLPAKLPFSRFSLQELITSAPLVAKKDLYQLWLESFSQTNTLWEDMLRFVGRTVENSCVNDSTISGVIEVYPGAISAFGFNPPIDNSSYEKAIAAYIVSDFEASANILTEIINQDGVTPEILNLLGASYLYLSNPRKAISYILLSFQYNCNTPYVVGNMILCLQQMDYPKLSKLIDVLRKYTIDDWSKEIINTFQNE